MNRRIAVVALSLSTLLAPLATQAQTSDQESLRKKHVDAAALEAITGSGVSCVGGQAGGFACQNVNLLSFLPLSDIGGAGADTNDIWGWTDPQTGKEYALVGREDGTALVDVSDPMMPEFLGILPTHSNQSLWRDLKVYDDHLFVVSEAGNHGLQVFDLTLLRSVVNPPVTFSESAHLGTFGSAHNIAINEDTGYAYVVGANTCSGGLYMVDISNPLLPGFAGCYVGDGYTHDAQCVVYNGPDLDYQGQEICFASNEDTITIIDVTNKANPQQISRNGYPQSWYTHQGWLTEDQQYFLLDDELDETVSSNTRTYVWDMIDLDDPVMIDIFSNTTSSIDHNLYVAGNHAFQSNYTSGLRILDASDPANLSEVGFFDTTPGNNSEAFLGTWSNYPFFASGVVIVSSMAEGLFVLEPVLDVAPPELTVIVTPSSPPVEIPAAGGSFSFTIEVVNDSGSSATTSLWLDIAKDGGAEVTRGPVQISVPANGSFVRNVSQTIPGGAPTGGYTLTVSVGTFPTADSSNGFPFTKLAPADSEDRH